MFYKWVQNTSGPVPTGSSPSACESVLDAPKLCWSRVAHNVYRAPNPYRPSLSEYPESFIQKVYESGSRPTMDERVEAIRLDDDPDETRFKHLSANIKYMAFPFTLERDYPFLADDEKAWNIYLDLHRTSMKSRKYPDDSVRITRTLPKCDLPIEKIHVSEWKPPPIWATLSAAGTYRVPSVASTKPCASSAVSLARFVLRYADKWKPGSIVIVKYPPSDPDVVSIQSTIPSQKIHATVRMDAFNKHTVSANSFSLHEWEEFASYAKPTSAYDCIVLHPEFLGSEYVHRLVEPHTRRIVVVVTTGASSDHMLSSHSS